MIERVALLSIHTSPLERVGHGHAGGMNIYVRRLADELCERGIEVDMFTRRTDRQAPEVMRTESGARLIHLAAGPPRHLSKSVLPLHVPGLVAAMRSFMQREGVRYDVLHSHYWLSGLVATRVRQDDHTPIVHMFHTLSKIKELYAGHPDPGDSALRPDGERCVVRHADAIVGATPMEGEYIERLYGRTPASFTVIPPGVDLDHFQPRHKQRSRSLLGIDGDRVVLFAGRVDRLKGLDVLLKASAEIAATAPYRLKVIVLAEDGNDRKRLTVYRHLARRLGLQSVVDFRGLMPHREMPAYYSAADVLAVPSAYESFGMAAVEAMACQTPVVAFAVGGLGATVKNGQTGLLVRPGDQRDFTTRLREALESADLDRMGRQARLAVQRYRWETVGDRTLTLYQRLVRGRVLLTPGASGAG